MKSFITIFCGSMLYSTSVFACNLPTPTPVPTPHKVTICHHTHSKTNPFVTITVDVSALPAHFMHGDTVGACSVPTPSPTPTPTPPLDCKGVSGGETVIDLCGVCGGDNSSCKDCKGVPNGGALDLCGACGGDNSTCRDCFGVPNGGKVLDDCGVCGGNNDSCQGCDGIANSHKAVDACGVCGGDSTSCLDCSGMPNGSTVVDLCGVCGGHNNTCLDCSSTPNGTKVVDRCGMCGGNGQSCVDCAGVPNGATLPDKCGVCNGTNSCLDCNGVANGGAVIDSCGVCGGLGGNLVTIKINKKKLLLDANTLLFKKTIPYFARAAKCNDAFLKQSVTGANLARRIHRALVIDIYKLQTEFRLCPGTCAKNINRTLIQEIHVLAKRLYGSASVAQHEGRRACTNTDYPVGDTKPFETNIHTIVNKCPNHLCK